MPASDCAFCWENEAERLWRGLRNVSQVGLFSPTFEIKLYDRQFALYDELDAIETSLNSDLTGRDFVARWSVKTEARAHALLPLAAVAVVGFLDLRQRGGQRLTA